MHVTAATSLGNQCCNRNSARRVSGAARRLAIRCVRVNAALVHVDVDVVALEHQSGETVGPYEVCDGVMADVSFPPYVGALEVLVSLQLIATDPQSVEFAPRIVRPVVAAPSDFSAST